MKTAAFVLFAVVTAAAAALSTLVATRYFSLEKELVELRFQLEDTARVRQRLEEDKLALRLERERVQANLDTLLAAERAQLEDCREQRQAMLQEVAATLANIQKRLSDIQDRQASPADSPQHSQAASPDPGPGTGEPQARGPADAPAPGGPTDVPKGRIPTPEQEARRLDKVQ